MGCINGNYRSMYFLLLSLTSSYFDQLMSVKVLFPLQITAEVGQKIELKLFRFAYTTEKTNSIIDSSSPCRHSLVIIDGTNQREVRSPFYNSPILDVCL